ncbi:hypothetical protein ACFSQD_16905 [Flavihumibacter stibioxidans]|uniref:Restriction endonuclease n=1 Tax=Flavihumibacter stibioxidans TaxID=1834163 RepID=A0ABR7M6K3_9BACT|nr:hypothetical protein [Flavihumibacter stibioxidans]MBC6490670.1 hypothetical protein [Flavihumibacter stibioxidans]
MTSNEILEKASNYLESLTGSTIPVLEVFKPEDLEYATHLSKVISKLSPLVGNMIEYNVCQILNKLDWENEGLWVRQDPGFPDTIFKGTVEPIPGIEIKTWFPLATEITARFKDSVKFFNEEQTNVALVAWLPEFIIYGKPRLIGIWVGTAKSLAEARDNHYHNPPDYLVFEPEDTSGRTQNLQQTNTNGYKFQGSTEEFKVAEEEVKGWGKDSKQFSHDAEYQAKLKQLMGKYNYRLDTNFAKIDRIQHGDLEEFKNKILELEIHGYSIKEWSKIIADEEKDITEYLNKLL